MILKSNKGPLRPPIIVTYKPRFFKCFKEVHRKIRKLIRLRRKS